MMNREVSSTKWGRTFVNVRLYADYLTSWHNLAAEGSLSEEKRLPSGISHTVYPNGKTRRYGT